MRLTFWDKMFRLIRQPGNLDGKIESEADQKKLAIGLFRPFQMPSVLPGLHSFTVDWKEVTAYLVCLQEFLGAVTKEPLHF